jgi:hypothetical protein
MTLVCMDMSSSWTLKVAMSGVSWWVGVWEAVPVSMPCMQHRCYAQQRRSVDCTYRPRSAMTAAVHHPVQPAVSPRNATQQKAQTAGDLIGCRLLS